MVGYANVGVLSYRFLEVMFSEMENIHLRPLKGAEVP